MNCKAFQDIIDTVGDMDRLPPAASRHSDACPECMRFGNDLVTLRALLREPDRVSAPADFDARLAARLRAHKASTRESRPWFLVGNFRFATAAVLATVLTGSVALVKLVDSETPATESGSSVATYVPTAPPVQPDVHPTSPPPTPDAASVPAPSPGTAPTPKPQATPNPSPRRTGSDAAALVAAVRPVHRTAVDRRTEPVTASAETMLFVRDESGARIVNVPDVIVGAREIVAPGAKADTTETMLF